MSAAGVQSTAASVPSTTGGIPLRRLVLSFIASLLVVTLAYLAFNVPGSWFPAAPERAWTGQELRLARGSGNLVNGEWVLQSSDANEVFVLSGEGDLRSTDYRVVAWIAVGLPATADVRLLWRSDYAPSKLNSIQVPIEAGRLRPVVVAGAPGWLGHITGVALAVRGPLPQPVRIRGVVVRPMGAFEVARDRVREWLAFEGWTGTSINTVVGGADIQDFPLPWFVVGAIAIALALALLPRWRLA